MEALKVGIREFRDTVGYFTPARLPRTDADKAALKEASARWQEILAAEGISEDDTVADFKQWRAKQAR